MHHAMRDELERALAGRADEASLKHLKECGECSAEFESMRDHAEALRMLRAPQELEPRPGFYARVLERIEAEGKSIWELVFESSFGRRIAYASMTLAVLLGFYLYTAERSEDVIADNPSEQIIEQVPMLPSMDLPNMPQVQSVGLSDGVAVPDPDSMLVNLVTFQDQ